MLLLTFFALQRQPADDRIVFNYGPSHTLGPLDCITLVLVGLLLIQLYRIILIRPLDREKRTELVLAACNLSMMFLFASILVINWAFYNPLSPGAYSVNSLGRHLRIIRPQPEYEPSGYWYETSPQWEKLDEYTYCDAASGIIIRDEIIIPGFSLASQRANFQARYPEATKDHFRDNSLTTRHYYDLNWTLFGVSDFDYLPAVRARLEETWSPWYEGESALNQIVESYEAAGSPPSKRPCKETVRPPFPPPTFPRTR